MLHLEYLDTFLIRTRKFVGMLRVYQYHWPWFCAFHYRNNDNDMVRLTQRSSGNAVKVILLIQVQLINYQSIILIKSRRHTEYYKMLPRCLHHALIYSSQNKYDIDMIYIRRWPVLLECSPLIHTNSISELPSPRAKIIEILRNLRHLIASRRLLQ